MGGKILGIIFLDPVYDLVSVPKVMRPLMHQFHTTMLSSLLFFWFKSKICDNCHVYMSGKILGINFPDPIYDLVSVLNHRTGHCHGDVLSSLSIFWLKSKKCYNCYVMSVCGKILGIIFLDLVYELVTFLSCCHANILFPQHHHTHSQQHCCHACSRSTGAAPIPIPPPLAHSHSTGAVPIPVPMVSVPVPVPTVSVSVPVPPVPCLLLFRRCHARSCSTSAVPVPALLVPLQFLAALFLFPPLLYYPFPLAPFPFQFQQCHSRPVPVPTAPLLWLCGCTWVSHQLYHMP